LSETEAGGRERAETRIGLLWRSDAPTPVLLQHGFDFEEQVGLEKGLVVPSWGQVRTVPVLSRFRKHNWTTAGKTKNRFLVVYA